MFLSQKGVKSIPLPALKSSAPFIFELRLWEWKLEIWAEMSRSWESINLAVIEHGPGLQAITLNLYK